MATPPNFPAAPPTIELGGRTGRLAADLIAVRGSPAARGTDAIAQLADDLAVYDAAEVTARTTPERAGPVYRLASGGLLVPTGRTLVRFAEGDLVEHHRGELAAAGYELDEPLSFAPNAGFVRRPDDDIAAALAGLAELRAIPGVEHVEPQALTERSSRRR